MLDSAVVHLRHHRRFYAALLMGGIAYFLSRALPAPVRLIAAGDVFFVAYLALVALVLHHTAADLRLRAAAEDEGILVVLLIVLTAIMFCCGSIFVLLHQSHGVVTLALAMALAGAPLGWLMLHVVAAFHYANLYYGPYDSTDGCGPPLAFPGGKEPDPWDFLYYAFVIGMTAQVSDVQVMDSQIRRATLGHAVVSFFFNTVLIAMAVNAAVTIAT